MKTFFLSLVPFSTNTSPYSSLPTHFSLLISHFSLLLPSPKSLVPSPSSLLNRCYIKDRKSIWLNGRTLVGARWSRLKFRCR